MAVPRNRTSNARKNSRRAHHAKKQKNSAVCPNCAAMRLPHRLCLSCGYYNNRSVLKQEEQA